jgi:hypothetical protein
MVMTLAGQAAMVNPMTGNYDVIIIGAVNPALTAMANALRVGDHILQRMA